MLCILPTKIVQYGLAHATNAQTSMRQVALECYGHHNHGDGFECDPKLVLPVGFDRDHKNVCS
jgi:hypothetical protein